MLFDSHGLEGFRYFIVDNDEKIIDELLYNFKNCEINDASQKIKLCTMTFDSSVWEKLSHAKKRTIKRYSSEFFFHLLQQFAKLKKTTKMNIVIVQNNLQELMSSTCGIFQLYFYKNLFDPSIQSKIINHQNLTVDTIQTLLNEIFTTEASENKYKIKQFKQEYL